MRNTRTYRIWAGMKNRCFNKNEPSYKYYGGRGIKLCSEWVCFERFFEDMGHAPEYASIDRIDNNGDYKKENCRWATRVEQANNKRNNRSFTINGETKTLSYFCKKFNIGHSLVLFRLSEGRTVEQAFGLIKIPKQEWSKRARMITLNGETKSLRAWAEINGIKRSTVAQRIYSYGWSVEKALNC